MAAFVLAGQKAEYSISCISSNKYIKNAKIDVKNLQVKIVIEALE